MDALWGIIPPSFLRRQESHWDGVLMEMYIILLLVNLLKSERK